MRKGSYKAIRTNKLRIKTKKSKKPTHNNDKINQLLYDLENGNTVPIKQFLKSLLFVEKPKINKGSKTIAEKLKDEAMVNQTDAEKRFAKVLRDLKIKYVSQRNIFVTEKKWYRVDFYLPFKRLVVEIDGEYHFTDEQIVLDKERELSLIAKKLNILRYKNSEVFEESFPERFLSEYNKIEM